MAGRAGRMEEHPADDIVGRRSNQMLLEELIYHSLKPQQNTVASCRFGLTAPGGALSIATSTLVPPLQGTCGKQRCSIDAVEDGDVIPDCGDASRRVTNWLAEERCHFDRALAASLRLVR